MEINEARRVLAIAEPMVGIRTSDAAIKRIVRRFNCSEGKAAILYEQAKATVNAADLKETMRKLNELAQAYMTTTDELVRRYA